MSLPENDSGIVRPKDYAEMGRLAARLALERIRGGRPSEPRRIVVPSDFVRRDSLAAAP